MENLIKNPSWGNYLSLSQERFPLDCEAMANLQSQLRIMAIMCALSGVDYLILTGCQHIGSNVTEGYCYIRKSNELVGNIYYHPIGTFSGSNGACYTKETSEDVTVDNELYQNAHSTLTLVDGIATNGETQIYWSAFTNVSNISNKSLLTAINTHTSNISTINSTLSSLQTTVNNNVVSYTVPTGTIAMWSTKTAPSGWLLCNGQAVSRSTYSKLYGVIGTTFGYSSSSDFKVPDFRDRFPLGAGNSYALNAHGGEKAHTLTTSEIPSHSHSYTRSEASSNGHTMADGTSRTVLESTSSYSASTSYVGSSAAHNNMPPYIGIYFIIKT